MAITNDPNWWRNAIVYQVYPRSFADADGDGLGDIRGITSRVPYLQDLGVDAVWLSPFYPSPLADGGYDVADYRDVDPRLGTLADLDTLIATLHEAGIRLIVDIVPNHSSSEHPWFRAALASPKGSPERARYIFMDGVGTDGDQPPSDWNSHFGGSAWTRLDDGQFYLHLFAPEQPDYDWRNPEVREEFLSILRFWSDRGVDGFRIDVAHALVKDMREPLRSQPTVDDFLPEDGSDPLYDRDELDEIYATWRAVFNEYEPPRMAVAEAWVPASRRPRYAGSNNLGQAFNFDLLNTSWNVDDFASVIRTNLDLADQAGSSSTWVLSNHDRVRHATRYALPPGTDFDEWLMGNAQPDDDAQALGLARARAATLLILALPGCTYFYQGEELGLPEVATIGPDDLQDPIWLRSSHERKGRDGCRVPLPWTDGGDSFGFGGIPHLPQPEWFRDYAASIEEADPDSTLRLYQAATAARRELIAGDGVTVAVSGTLLIIEREGGWTSVTNFADEPGAYAAPGEVVLVSEPQPDAGVIPGATTVWYRTD